VLLKQDDQKAGEACSASQTQAVARPSPGSQMLTSDDQKCQLMIRNTPRSKP